MYEHRIVVAPAILVGKPIVRGTHIAVALVLERLADDLDVRALFEAHPHLTPEDVKACLKYARGIVAGEDVFPMPAGPPRATDHHSRGSCWTRAPSCRWRVYWAGGAM